MGWFGLLMDATTKSRSGYFSGENLTETSMNVCLEVPGTPNNQFKMDVLAKAPFPTVDGWNLAPPGMYENPLNTGIFTISTGAGFLPSTVCKHLVHHPIKASIYSSGTSDCVFVSRMPRRSIMTNHFRYPKVRNPRLCNKLYGYGLCKGKTTPQHSLTRFCGNPPF